MGEIGRDGVLQKALIFIEDFAFLSKSKEEPLTGSNQRNDPILSFSVGECMVGATCQLVNGGFCANDSNKGQI